MTVLRRTGVAVGMAMLAAGCTVASDDPVVRPENDGSVAEPELEPTPSMRSQLIGQWRLVKESTEDGSIETTVQGRRLLALHDDGGYHMENYVAVQDETWTLDGDTLEFQVSQVTFNPVTSKPKKKLVTERATVLSVDAHELVLVEDIPEIYLRDGPPQKARNTYRRVSQEELGPMLGEPLQLSRPGIGRYVASYQYGMNKYPTMEINIRQSIQGHAELRLGADGEAGGCIGYKNHEYFSESEYSSRDKKAHHREDEQRQLLAFRATWEPRGEDRVGVTLERFWRDTCRAPVGDGDVMGPVEFECTLIAKNEKLPADALACRVVSGWTVFHELALNPADTERSGPFTLQSDPMGHIQTDQGRPWLLLGAGKGLTVHSDDGRGRESPVVTFTSPAADLVESHFIPKPEPTVP